MQINTIENDHRLLRQAMTSLITQRAFDSSFRYKKSPTSWSAEEIIHHIILAKQLTGDLLEKLLAKHNVETLKTEKVVDVVIREALDLMDFDRVLAEVPAMKGTEPSSNLDKAELLGLLDRASEVVIRLLQIGKKRDLSAIQFPHPLFGHLNFYEWLYFDLIHTKGHFYQIEKLGLF